MALTNEEKVTSCEAYDQSKRCIRCSNGFLLKNFACEEITAQNCETYTDAKTCATCANMYYLDLDVAASPKSCIQLTIPNCLKNNLNKCVLCESTHKLSSNGESCEILTNTKPNCSGYDSNEKCIQCETPFILNPETGKCLIEESMEKFLDPNCEHFRLSPQCNTCKEGFYFNDSRTCTSCEIEGCHFCSRGAKRCNLCRTGFYMDHEGKCLKNSNVEFDSFDVVDDLTEFEGLFMKFNSIMFLVFAFIFLNH